MYRVIVITLLLLIILNTCVGCTFFVAKETIEVIDSALEKSPNPEKKKKILKKQQTLKDKSREFYCSKVKDKEKCGE
jgi:predicted PurR-regulated permease PerM